MEMHQIDPMAGIAVMLALAMAGVTQLRSGVTLYGLQSLAVGLLAILTGRSHHEPWLILVGCAVGLLKGIAVPAYLNYSARRIGCRTDASLIIAPPLQLFIALGGLVLLVLARPFHTDFSAQSMTAFAVLLLGMQQMLTRRLAISQIIGFLVIENGIFIFTVVQPHSMPIVVELGVLMDVLAGTMLAGLLAFRINRSFEHIDVAEMKELRG